MCKLCDEGKPQDHTGSQLGRRDFLKASTATAHVDALLRHNAAPAWSTTGPRNEEGRSPPGSPVVFACTVPRDLHYLPLAEGRSARLLVRVNTCIVPDDYSLII